MTKEIPLTQGKVALVSDHQYERVSQFKWHAIWSGCWYAVRTVNRKPVRLHRFLMNVTDSKIQVDHINGDGLDCRDENMRVCTPSENQHNSRKRRDNTTGYKGVINHHGKYRARINLNGKWVSAGYFSDPVSAALAYDEAAKKYFGNFARLNFPEQS